MSATPAAAAPPALSVMIVEDEILIRMLFEDMLSDLGHQIEGAASRLEDALALAAATRCDLAILDVHLNGSDVFPAAEVLAERGIPFIFATGYGDTGIPEKFRGRPTLQKPFQADQLRDALAAVVAARAAT